jgi:hypothetical protein
VAMMPSKREIAAHHEAGHAVVALAFRIPVFSASIKPRGASRGRVTTQPRLAPDKAVDIQLLSPSLAPSRIDASRRDHAHAMIFGKGKEEGHGSREARYLADTVGRAEEVLDYFCSTSRPPQRLCSNTRR